MATRKFVALISLNENWTNADELAGAYVRDSEKFFVGLADGTIIVKDVHIPSVSNDLAYSFILTPDKLKDAKKAEYNIAIFVAKGMAFDEGAMLETHMVVLLEVI